jgi:orotidine-5'-phosphate decarboxylase
MYGHHESGFLRPIAYAHAKGMLVIADCKRNDIGSTAEAYATAYLGRHVCQTAV